MKFKAIAVVISTILLTGCLNGSNSSPSANQVSVTVQNANGNNISSVALTPNSTTVVKFHNNSNYSVANPTFTTNLPSGVTASGDCTGLVPQGDCTITLTSSNTATGAGSMSLSGDNIENNPISVPVAVTTGNVTFTPVSGATQPATLRGLKYQEVTITNNTAYSVLLQNNDALSELSNLAIATDTAHTENTCLSSTTAAGGSCHFWVVANNGPDVGSQTANNLSFSYLVNGANIETQQTALNATVETDLYMAGGFTTQTNTCYAGGVAGTCTNLAKWNGTEWKAVGNNFNFGPENKPIYDISTGPNGNIVLFLGAAPLTIGGVATNYLANWDGVNWDNLDGGISRTVDGNAILNNVYSQQIFAWNDNTNPSQPVMYFFYPYSNSGTDEWYLGSWAPNTNTLDNNVLQFTGVDAISALSVNSDNLYALQLTAGNGTINYANLAGTLPSWGSWSTFSTTGFNSFAPYSIFFDNNTLYTGGAFEPAPGGNVYVLSTYDLSTSGEFNPYYLAGSADDDFSSATYPQLVANGTFYFTADNFAGNARILSAPTDNLNSYTELGVSNTTGKSISGTKAVVVTSNGTLYAAGGFDGMNSVTSNCIAKEDGGTWSALLGPNNDIATTCQGGQAPLGLILTPTLSIQ